MPTFIKYIGETLNPEYEAFAIGMMVPSDAPYMGHFRIPKSAEQLAFVVDPHEHDHEAYLYVGKASQAIEEDFIATRGFEKIFKLMRSLVHGENHEIPIGAHNKVYGSLLLQHVPFAMDSTIQLALKRPKP